ncbi:hypothetical protein CANCADRAFT_17296, partial [Tortispora caseinolytica NRRL Y-17796]
EIDDIIFWRFPLEVQLTNEEQKVYYWINKTPKIYFYVPAVHQTMNQMFQSCNGFSLGADPATFPACLWEDVLNAHQTTHFHVMYGGGDQIYSDIVTKRCKPLLDWTQKLNLGSKYTQPMSEQFEADLDECYFKHYLDWFGKGYFNHPVNETYQPYFPIAMAMIPMVNIFDDHDIIDGFGTYSNSVMRSPVFKGVGRIAFKNYMLFQHQSLPSEPEDPNSCYVYGAAKGPYIEEYSRSVVVRAGVDVLFLGLDCRTERKLNQVVTKETYEKVFKRVREEVAASNGAIKHLVVMLGVPIFYPRLVFLEKMLTSRVLSGIKYLAVKGLFMKNLVNRFDHGIEILDDLNDHWCAGSHKKERNELVQRMMKFASDTKVRVSILSGDVHLAAVGFFRDPKISDIADDPSYMVNIVSSAITNTPPGDLLAKLLKFRNKTHRLHQAKESLLSVFALEPDGTKRKNTYLLNKRNWCAIEPVNQAK